jgi:hypothetical protein
VIRHTPENENIGLVKSDLRRPSPSRLARSSGSVKDFDHDVVRGFTGLLQHEFVESTGSDRADDAAEHAATSVCVIQR